MWPVQAGMREQASGEVTIQDAREEVVQVLLAFMYGRLTELQDDLLLPLFIVADAYQASPLLDYIHACCAKQITRQFLLPTAEPVANGLLDL